MIITDDFVMLNLPKTGSTFARSAISDVFELRQKKYGRIAKLLQSLGLKHQSSFTELLLPNIKIAGAIYGQDQHGTFAQIPDCYRDRDVVSIVRNPYSRFLSTYEFRHWEKYPFVPEKVLAENFPHFPDLSFDDYVRFNELQITYGRLGGKTLNANVGNQTIQFIQMFFKNPDSILVNLSDNYLDSEDIFNDMADVRFLRTEALNDELALFLEEYRFSSDEIEYVQNKKKINETVDRHNRDELWTPLSLAYVREKERMIFRLLEKKGIFYSCPKVDYKVLNNG